MDFPIQINAISMDFYIIYLKGSQVRISNSWCNSFPENCFDLNKSVDPDEMPYFAAFHLGLHCFPKYP